MEITSSLHNNDYIHNQINNSQSVPNMHGSSSLFVYLCVSLVNVEGH